MMIRTGNCAVDTNQLFEHKETFLRLESEAREAKRGMWALADIF